MIADPKRGSGTFRRSREIACPAMASWLLSGFRSDESYGEREPDWEGDVVGSIDDATRNAREWLADQQADACVEVIADDGKSARVVRVVTSAGVEDIG
jgi:hypothetical protein